MSSPYIVEYKKPLRIPTEKYGGKAAISGKNYMRQEDVQRLLSGKVLVEEKMDGRFCRFEHESFAVFAEDLKFRHSIKYRVPARYAIFDIYDKKSGLYLGNEGKIEVYKEIKRMPNFFKETNSFNFFLVPLVERGEFSIEQLIEMLERKSSYALPDGAGKVAHMEGIVIKPDRNLPAGDQLFGKIVRKEFVEGITINYLRMPKRLNIIDPRITEKERDRL